MSCRYNMTIMRLLLLSVLATLIGSQTSDDCNDFQNNWQPDRECSNSEVSCLRRLSQTIKISATQIVLDCKGSSPDKMMFICSKSTESQVEFQMIDCSLDDFSLSTYLNTVVPRIMRLLYTREENVLLTDLKIFNVSSLKELYVTGNRNPFFRIKFQPFNALLTFEVEDHNFTFFGSSPFKHLHSLTNLAFRKGSMGDLDDHLLSGLYSLKQLRLDWNQISEISPNALDHTPNLNLLDLTGNKMSRINENVFSRLGKLERLYIGHNNIISLTADFFKYLPSLCTLDISGNTKMETLPNGLLANSMQLKEFYVSKCGLKTFPRNLFIEKLYPHSTIYENKDQSTFSCFNLNCTVSNQDVSQLEILDISHNNISIIENSTFELMVNLVTLDLSHNPIRRLPRKEPFGPAENLRKVEMINCSLTELPNIDLATCRLNQLDVTHNNIKNVTLPVYSTRPKGIFLESNSIVTINLDYELYSYSPFYYLDNNAINCNCELKSFIQFLRWDHKKALRIFRDAEILKCAETFESIFLLDMRKIDVSCQCPENCICRVIGENVEVNCSRKRILSAPQNVPQESTIVLLDNNYITTLSNLNATSWNHVRRLSLTNNSLVSLDNWNIPPNLSSLALDGNWLIALPSLFMKTVAKAENFNIYLARNNWKCGYENYCFLEWLRENRDKIKDYKSIMCNVTIWNNESSVDFFLKDFTSIFTSVYCVSLDDRKAIMIIPIIFLLLFLYLWCYIFKEQI